MGQESCGRADVIDLERQLDRGDGPSGRLFLSLAQSHARLSEDHEAFRALRRLVAADETINVWTGARRVLQQLRQRTTPPGTTSLRVALLGTSTLDPLGDLLELAGLAGDLDLEVYSAGFGQYEAEVLDPSSGLHAFAPAAVVLAPDTRAIDLPPLSTDPGGLLAAELARWTGVWQALRERTDALVLQCNFVPLLERPLGSLEAGLRGSRRTLVHDLNQQLAEDAGTGVHIVDVAAVAAAHGLRQWHDDRYWFHGKQATSLGALPWLAREIVAVLQAATGRSRKCLVADLDGTLWGGRIGEDGLEGITLGGTPVGDAHLALQEYLRDLKTRGIVLAVCSKNDEAIAKIPFLEREDMRLSLDDFAAFVANWEPKSDNIRRIAASLDLGLESFVFIDDEPAERDLIRQQLPEVDVIDLPSDPAQYRRTLANYRGFETVAVTEEDASRTNQYRARAKANELRSQTTTLDAFLHSLDMTAYLQPFDGANLQRVAQLVAKTNQWNLTTNRHSLETLHRYADDPRTVTRALRLEDRFGDHGIVAIAIAMMNDNRLEIDSLLMSCRVIGRSVERTLLDELVDAARAEGLTELQATYRRTLRNSVVADVLPRLGFMRVGGSDDESTWALPMGSGEQWQANPFIQRRP